MSGMMIKIIIKPKMANLKSADIKLQRINAISIRDNGMSVQRNFWKKIKLNKDF